MKTGTHKNVFLTYSIRLGMALILLAGALAALPVVPVRAATLTVTTAIDENDHSCVDGDCSLRDALEVAAAGDTINFAGGLSGATITLGSTLTLTRDVTIDGSALASKITISGNNSVRVMWINASVTVTLNSLIIANGKITTGNYNGGGIYNNGALTIRNSTLSGNQAPTNSTGSGGAIYNNTGGTVLIDTCSLTGNYAYGAGGAIYNNGTFEGGGNSISIFNSTLNNNIVTNAWGGAIYNYGSNMSVINSTLAANSAYRGGAIYNETNSKLWIRNATIAGNTAEAGPVGNGGGGIYNTGSNLYLSNTILSSNTGYDCYSTVGANENANNLIRSSKLYNECKLPGDVLNTSDPLIGSLANNGGPTLTMALGDGSPAIDAGDAGICAYAGGVNNRDQRGVVRPLGAVCDIGAYEYAPKNITAFSFASPAATGVIAGTSITVNFPYGTDLSSLVPTVTYSGASLNPGSGAVQDFTSPVTYTVTAADATTKGYTVTVSACDPTGLVTNTSDSGFGSLRQAILAACPGGTITFNGNYAIELTSAELTIDKNLTINGSGHTVSISGKDTLRVFNINSGVTATLSNLEITHGYSDTFGGGIQNAGTLTLSNSKVTSNRARIRGGGLYNNGTMTVTDSTISGNLAGVSALGLGGGIYIAPGAITTIKGSTFSNNTAVMGGGIMIDTSGALTLANSTLTGNIATGYTTTLPYYSGGGIMNGGTLTITNSTLAGNNGSGVQAGGIQNAAPTGILNYSNTIIADSLNGADCTNANTIGTNTNNLVEDGTCSATLSGDPKLGILQNNGGPTWTMAIDATSPAFDTGSNAFCAVLSVNNLDQRGVTRPQVGQCDIGAYEFDPLPVLLSFIRQNPATSSTNADVLVFQVTFSENMQNVDTTDFLVNSTSTATVTAVSAVTGTSVFNVTVSGGDLVNYNGTVGLNLRGTQNIQDLTGNALPNTEPASDETYTVFNNLAPTDIGLSNSTVEEALPFGTLVGTLSTVDPNVGDTHTYSLPGGVPGCNGADNASFQISGNQLLTSATFNRAVKSSYAICVRTTDSTSLTYNKAFTITVTATKAITAFTIPGQVGGTTINNTAGTIALTVPYGTNLTTLTPTIAHTGASISPASGAVHNFTSPVLYIVTGVDLSTKGYTVTVTTDCANTITVANANESGTGSLRQALADICTDGTITFAPGLAGSTIPLSTQLNIIRNVTVDGSGLTPQISISGQHSSRVFSVSNGVTAALNGLEIMDGAAASGAGILNNGTLTVSNCTLSGNSASYAGAILNNSFSTLTVTDSSFLGNTAAIAGGAMMNYYQMTVMNSTFSGNSVTAYNSVGGAIHDAGGTLTVTNSTFSGNNAGDTSNLGMGGALSVSGGGTLTVTNSTLAGNTASLMGSAIYSQLATLNYSNTIITGSAAVGYYLCEVDSLGTNSHNLVEDGSCSSALSGDPKLGLLQNNGGPTWTMALLTGSPALDGGVGCPVNDQRGFSRSQGIACDIGAFELRTQKDITAFDFTSPAATGVIAWPSIAVTVPYLTDVTALVPTITHTGTSISPAGGAAHDFTNPVTYTVTAEDGTTQTYSVTVTVALNPAKAITDFTILGQVGGTTINEAAGTIGLTMPFGTNVTALVPYITHTGVSVSPDDSETQNFTSPVPYTVTAADLTTKVYTVTVTVAPNPAKAITAFTIPSQVGGTTINEALGTIDLTMPYGTNLTTLTPAITHTGASVSPASGEVHNFTGPATYTVTAADLTTKVYTVTVATACANTITVANNADSGTGSLRQAINDICTGGTINFNGNYTITLDSELSINQDLTIDGTGHTVTVSGGNLRRVFYVSNVDATIKNLTIANGKTVGGGAGIYLYYGTLTLSGVTLLDNTANDPTYSGGGIYNYYGTLNIRNSTFSGNKATNGGGSGAMGSGGGIYNDSGMVTISNTTFSGNTATDASGGGSGGGIYNNYGTLTISNSTFSGNAATVSNGGNASGSILNLGTTATIKNTIIANSPSGANCSGTLTDGGHNLDSGATCGFSILNGSLSNIDPLLSILGNYGGSTQTFALLPGSLAMDAGDPTTCAGLPGGNLDQRGTSRVGACDIGAFESQGFSLALGGGNNQSTIASTAFTISLQVNVTSNASPVEPVNGGQVTFTAPGSGASATFGANPANIASGSASVIATANAIDGGPYPVTANTAGATAGVNFSLTNLPTCYSTITVKSGANSGADTLRQAMADLCVGGTITFDNDYTIPLGTTLTIDKDMTISGAGHSITLDGQGSVRVFAVNSGVTATLNALTITNGNSEVAPGGGIYNHGTLTVTNSTLTGNFGAQGGGIYNDSSTLTVTNTTLSGNTSEWSGGGIYNYVGTLTLMNSTLSGNRTNQTYGYGGGLYNYGTLHYTNTIIANSPHGADCVQDGGSIVTNINNLVRDGGCPDSGVNFRTGDPKLAAALAPNGGTTWTFALLANSPAIDNGTNTGCPALDQRGTARPLGARCDIGAYEYVDTTPPAVSAFTVTTPINSLTIPITVFSGTDDVAITGYLVTESASQPAAGAAGWTSAVPGYTVLADGPYYLYPWVKDASGNVSGPYSLAPLTAVVDTTAPLVTISTIAPDPTNAGTVITWHADENGTYSLRVGGTSCTTGTQVASGAYTTPATVNLIVAAADLVNGSNTLRVCVADALGNTGSTTGTVVKDTTAPVIVIDTVSPNPTNTGTTVTWHADTNGPYQVRVGGADCTDGTLVDSGTYSTTPTTVNTTIAAGDLAAGANTLRVCVTDPAGNTGQGTGSVTKDVSAPAVTSILRQTPATNPTNLTTVAFRVTFAEDVQNVGPTDFDPILTGSVTATINAVIVQPDGFYDVVLTGVGGNGTLGLTFKAGNDIADLSGNLLGTAPTVGTNQTYTIDNTAIEIVLTGGVVGEPGTQEIFDTETYQTHFTTIEVTFNADAYNPAGDTDPDDVTNPENYLLLQTGLDGEYDTPSCSAYALDGIYDDDVQIETGPVTYSNTDGFVATVTVNGGNPLPSGDYRLFICGSTSITDLAGNELNSGADVVLNFRITDPPKALPSTGFAPNRVTALPEQTVAYTASDLWLEIPKLGVQMDIVGVPQSADGTWDVSWLGDNAGWLNGSAYPTWNGNSVLTGHVVDANGKAGPFRYINTLWYGDQVIVHAGGADYVYAVRSVQQVGPGSTAAMMKHEDLPWVTLVTCRGYDPLTGDYQYRVLVRAVLVEVK